MHAIRIATALLLDDYPATRRANQKRLDVLVQLLDRAGAEVNTQREMLHQAFTVPKVRSRRGGD